MATLKVGKSMLKMDLITAVDRAQAGDVISIEAGAYHLATVIQKNLTFEAADPQRPPVISGLVKVAGAKLRARHIEFRNDESSSVFVEGGEFQADHCHFASRAGNALYCKERARVTVQNSQLESGDHPAVYAEQSSVTLTRVEAVSSESNALYLLNQATAELQECAFSGIGKVAVYVESARMTLSRSTVRSTDSNAVYCIQGAQVEIADSDVESQTFPAVACSESRGTLRRVQARSQTANAIYLFSASECTLQECECQSGNAPTVYIEASTAQLHGCTLSSAEGNALYCLQQSKVDVTASQLTSINSSAVAYSGSKGTLTQVQAKSDNDSALYAFDLADVTVQGGAFLAPRSTAVFVENAQLKLSDTVVRSQEGNAAFGKAKAQLNMVGCELESVSLPAVAYDDATGLLQRVTAKSVEGHAVYAFNGANVTGQDCTLTGDKVAALCVEGATGRLSGSSVRSTESNAVFCNAGARFDLTESELHSQLLPAVAYLEGSTGRLSQVQATSQGDSGLFVSGQAEVTVQESQFQSVSNTGVVIDGAKAKFSGCTLSSLTGNALFCKNGSSVDISHSQIEDVNPEYYSLYFEDSSAIISNSRIVRYADEQKQRLEEEADLKVTGPGSWVSLTRCEFLNGTVQALADEGGAIDFGALPIAGLRIWEENGGQVYHSGRRPNGPAPQESAPPEPGPAPVTTTGPIPVPSVPVTVSAPVAAYNEEIFQAGMAELNALIGLEDVKQEVRKLVALVKLHKRREAQGLPAAPVTLHLVFTGNPGTGKTTVARIIGKIYHGLGLLGTENVIETDRSGLVGQWIGHTAIKTNEIIDKAMDGILFIDEAYSLVVQDSANDFGKEAIDTLLKQMEDNRHRLAVIVAGYTQPMTQFIQSNPGLSSRFTRMIPFADYAPEDLLRIFRKMASDVQYDLSEAAEQALDEGLRQLYANRDHHFGNARIVRTLFENTVEQHALRIDEDLEASLSTFEDIDIVEAFNSLKRL